MKGISEVTAADIAAVVVEGIKVGSFKSTECQDLIRQRWPDHPLVSVQGPRFGMEFKNYIWPVLKEWGVEKSNQGKNPVRYEMTEQAKKAVRRR